MRGGQYGLEIFTGGLLFCIICGLYIERREGALHKPCRMKPSCPSRLKCMLEGKHPISRQRLPGGRHSIAPVELRAIVATHPMHDPPYFGLDPPYAVAGP